MRNPFVQGYQPAPETTTKLCRDCKWVSNPGQFAWCNAPQNYRDTLNKLAEKYTGFEVEEANKKTRWKEDVTCTFHRSENFLFCRLPPYTCGKEGRWFEPNS